MWKVPKESHHRLFSGLHMHLHMQMLYLHTCVQHAFNIHTYPSPTHTKPRKNPSKSLNSQECKKLTLGCYTEWLHLICNVYLMLQSIQSGHQETKVTLVSMFSRPGWYSQCCFPAYVKVFPLSKPEASLSMRRI